jgi:hypothetical protein
MAVELGSLSLEKLTSVAVHEHARLVHHEVPGLAGSLAQTLGRSSVRIELQGIIYGASVADDLKSLRSIYLDQKPVDFFADAVGEGYFTQVLISHLEVAQRAAAFDEYDYCCELVEYVEPPEPAALDALSGLDTGILAEAGAFMDDVQNAIETVSDLANALANIPNFGNPTEQLSEMPTEFTSTVTGEGLTTLTTLRDVF